jgi:hypothetical protein
MLKEQDIEALDKAIRNSVDSSRIELAQLYLGPDTYYARLHTINGTGQIHDLPAGTTNVILSMPEDKPTSKHNLDTLKRVSNFHPDLNIIAATPEKPNKKQQDLLLNNGAKAIMEWGMYTTPQEFESVREQLESSNPQL